MKEPKYFALDEFLTSETAAAWHMDNFPSWTDVERMRVFAIKTLDLIREKWGEPLLISSGFRTPELNSIVGGSPTSNHMDGLAVDIMLPAWSNKKLLNLYLLINTMTDEGVIDIDQVIYYRKKEIIHIGIGERLRKQFIVKP